MSGSIDIGFGGSGGGASAGGNATFTSLSLGTAPYATAGDLRFGTNFSVKSGTGGLTYMGGNGNGYTYFGDASIGQGVVFGCAGGSLNLYPSGLTVGGGGNVAFGGQLQGYTQTVQTTAPAAGGAAALPATPKGYWQFFINGATQFLPYY